MIETRIHPSVFILWKTQIKSSLKKGLPQKQSSSLVYGLNFEKPNFQEKNNWGFSKIADIVIKCQHLATPSPLKSADVLYGWSLSDVKKRGPDFDTFLKVFKDAWPQEICITFLRVHKLTSKNLKRGSLFCPKYSLVYFFFIYFTFILCRRKEVKKWRKKKYIFARGKKTELKNSIL